jgi:hypothetical protein
MLELLTGEALQSGHKADAFVWRGGALGFR